MANNDRHYAICPVCSTRFFIHDKKSYALSKWLKLKNGNAKKFFCSIKCFNQCTNPTRTNTISEMVATTEN